MGIIAIGAWSIVTNELTTVRGYATLLGLILLYPAAFYALFLLWRLATGQTSIADLRDAVTNAEGQRSATFGDRIASDERSTEEVIEEAFELLRNGRTGSYSDIILAMGMVHESQPDLLVDRLPELAEILDSRTDTVTQRVVLDTILLVLQDAPEELTVSSDTVATIARYIGAPKEKISGRAIEAVSLIELNDSGDIGEAAPALASILATGGRDGDPSLFVAAAGAAQSRPHVFDPCTDIILHYAREGEAPTRIAALLMLSKLQAVSERDAVESIADAESNDDVASAAQDTLENLENIHDLIGSIADDVTVDQDSGSPSG